MRFSLLTPGTGSFYCGTCLRDATLARTLQALGHEALITPIYLPLVLEEDAPNLQEPRVRLGGVNVWLHHHSRLVRRLPRRVADLLDSPSLLRRAARRAGLTHPGALGGPTLSILQGEHGPQANRVRALVEELAAGARPDVVVLSNALLAGLAGPLRARLGSPVVCTLQGEEPFLDALGDPFSQRAWEELRKRAGDVDRFVAVSRTHGERMRLRLGLPADRIEVVHNGIALEDYPDEPAPLAERHPPALGYLARMCADKGLPLLVEAFVRLVRRGHDALRLRIAGACLQADRPLVRALRRRLAREGLTGRVDWLPDVSREQKIAFLASLRVFSVPATYRESFGLYVLEALAAGVPVVQPRSGAFRELLEATHGGVLCEPEDPDALADALEALLLDTTRAQRLVDRGRAAVLRRFTAERMARGFVAACDAVRSSES